MLKQSSAKLGAVVALSNHTMRCAGRPYGCAWFATGSECYFIVSLLQHHLGLVGLIGEHVPCECHRRGLHDHPVDDRRRIRERFEEHILDLAQSQPAL